MRTPSETLARLAELGFIELLPGGDGIYATDKGFRSHHRVYISANNVKDDVQKGMFTAWCKKQLRDTGYAFIVRSGTDDFQVVITKVEQLDHSTRIDYLKEVASAFCQTEWQAVAEALIQALEREKEFYKVIVTHLERYRECWHDDYDTSAPSAPTKWLGTEISD